MMKISKYILMTAMALGAMWPAAQAADGQAPATEISVNEAPKVKVVANRVDIEIPGNAPKHVDIYALTGQVVKQFDAQPGVSSVELPAGYYIVRVDRVSIKIAVK